MGKGAWCHIIGKNKIVSCTQVHHSVKTGQHIRYMYPGTGMDFGRRDKILTVPLNRFIASGKSYLSLTFFICKRISNGQGY